MRYFLAPFPRLLAAMHPLNGLTLVLFGRYVAISSICVAVDLVVFLQLLSSGFKAVPASVAGYLCGTQLHWLLSTRTVFIAGLQAETDARRRQQAMFFASALVGVGCSAMIVAASEWLLIPLLIGKLGAVGASFVVVLLLRSMVIFAPGRA